MAKKRKTVKKKRARASDFGDNPHIRRRFGEAEKFDRDEPWEVYYRKKKRELTRSLVGSRKKR